MLLITWLAWSQRWMSEDGFINVRVVQQILDGHGPVFNAGERVEATTSPLWLLALVVGKAVFFSLPVEWIAVLLGMSTTIAAVTLPLVGAWRLHGTRRLPLGILAYVVLPPAAVHATAGLETGLTLLWISGWFLLLLRAAERSHGRTVLAAAFVLGLGPLVRPDLVVMSAVGGAALLLGRPHGSRRLGAICASALGLPAAYGLFRMSYYGNLLPNSAYAKEATAANWPQGWHYLQDFSDPYLLPVPALVLGLAAAAAARRLPRARALAFATPVVAGLVYGWFVVRGGGDFMHARMLLPAAFALQLPLATVPLRRTNLALLGAILVWATLPLRAGGPPYGGLGPNGIANERGLWVGARGNPVTLEDYASVRLVRVGTEARERGQNGSASVDVVVLGSGTIRHLIQPLSPDAPAFVRGGVLGVRAIGMASVAAGNEVYVADQMGLASPIGSRLELPLRRRPGHEKVLPPAWTFAMFGAPEAPVPESISPDEVALAREALRCPAIDRMLRRARDPLTPGRIGRNVVESFTDFGTRIRANPKDELRRCHP